MRLFDMGVAHGAAPTKRRPGITATSVVSTASACVTVREVMAIYHISRYTAYEQARLFLAAGPGHGIPCIRLGHSIRFPVAWIEAHIGAPLPGVGSASTGDAATA